MPRALDGYPCSIGNRMLSVFPHLGPASYTQLAVTPGTVPATGGDTLNANESGLRWFDAVQDAISDDGAWNVEAVPVTVSNPTGTGSSALSGIPSKTFLLRWIARKTATIGGQAQTAGNEAVAATNLSTVCVRLTALGPN